MKSSTFEPGLIEQRRHRNTARTNIQPRVAWVKLNADWIWAGGGGGGVVELNKKKITFQARSALQACAIKESPTPSLFGKKLKKKNTSYMNGGVKICGYVFVSFPHKRNGIVFSSGVNYLHSGGNIQSE